MFNWNHQYVNILPTLVCNHTCPYCITKFSEYFNEAAILEHSDHSWQEWREALSKFPLNTIFIFNGGEPTLFPGFAELINSFPNKRIGIGTNLKTEDTLNKILSLTKHNTIISASIHPIYISNGQEILDMNLLDKIIERINIIKDNGFSFTCHVICYPTLKDETIEYIQGRLPMLQYGKDNFLGIYNNELHLLSHCDINAFTGRKSKVVCGLKNPVIGPSGDIYACGYAMYTKKKDLVLGNIFKNYYSGYNKIYCEHYGMCNPCDFAEMNRDITRIED